MRGDASSFLILDPPLGTTKVTRMFFLNFSCLCNFTCIIELELMFSFFFCKNLQLTFTVLDGPGGAWQVGSPPFGNWNWRALHWPVSTGYSTNQIQSAPSKESKGPRWRLIPMPAIHGTASEAPGLLLLPFHNFVVLYTCFGKIVHHHRIPQTGRALDHFSPFISERTVYLVRKPMNPNKFLSISSFLNSTPGAY